MSRIEHGRLTVVQHCEVYRHADQFAGWPANYGLWIWDEEVVVVFAQGRLGAQGDIHARDRAHAFVPRQARSFDGGLTWACETFNGRTPGGRTLSADEHVEEALRAQGSIDPGQDLSMLRYPVDFLDPETIVLAARTGIWGHPVSWFYVSRDRARSWQGPYAINPMGLPGISARTDIVPLSHHDALFMLTSTKSSGEEGRVFCARTSDGGTNFRLQSFLMGEAEGYAIMPASVLLHDGRVLTLVRRMGGGPGGWIDTFVSDDLGLSWDRVGYPIETGYGGNPPAVSILPGGSIALIYGYRDKPYGVRCRISHDGGSSWSTETIVREDGGSPDLGYPRIVMRSDKSSLLAVYYFNEYADRERFIAASIIHLPI
ncbi:hypothetical protein LPJGGPFB_05185 [Ensifer adhaerens]|uniref:sialidase family protein n=1 Tax=Ensifer adhaerens TaxID=106592 RepID=UPI00156A22F8|nr:sialidase family protein [Ensifer adhaerens]NRP21926.1 hypothetical protein [Ensifer adhaerens]